MSYGIKKLILLLALVAGQSVWATPTPLCEAGIELTTTKAVIVQTEQTQNTIVERGAHVRITKIKSSGTNGDSTLKFSVTEDKDGNTINGMGEIQFSKSAKGEESLPFNCKFK